MACEGALLVVDAAQGVEAQTLANVYLAIEAGLEIIPVLNKIDLPGAEPERVCREIEEVIGLECSDGQAIMASAKQVCRAIEYSRRRSIFQSLFAPLPFWPGCLYFAGHWNRRDSGRHY